MLRIAVCDDLPQELERAAAHTRAYLREHGTAAELVAFSRPEMLLRAHREAPFDLLILDVCMPALSGIQLGRALLESGGDAQLIYLTTSPDYAVDAFALKAAHYLLKPFSQAQFNLAMERAVERFAAKTPAKLLLLTENGTLQAIDAKTVFYVESVGQERVVHTRAGLFREQRLTLSRLLEELEALLPGRFIMPYRGYIVNQDEIRTIATTGITLQNGESIPIKRRDFRRLREAFFQWSFAGREDRC